MKYYSICEFVELIGISKQQLEDLGNIGNPKPSQKWKRGYWYYSQQQLQKNDKGVATR